MVSDEVTYEIRHQRNARFLFFVPIWMAFWLFFEVLIGFLILRGLWNLPAEIQRDGGYAIGGLVIGAILLAWLTMWSYLGFIMARAWLWNRFGRESISIVGGELAILRECLAWRRSKRYKLSEVQSLRCISKPGRSFEMMRVGQMCNMNVPLLSFDYRPSKKVQFGFGIEATSAEEIVADLGTRYPEMVAAS